MIATGEMKKAVSIGELGCFSQVKGQRRQKKQNIAPFLKFLTILPVSLFFMVICIYFIPKYKIMPADNISGLSSVFSENDFAMVIRCLKLGVAKTCVMTPSAFESLG